MLSNYLDLSALPKKGNVDKGSSKESFNSIRKSCRVSVWKSWRFHFDVHLVDKKLSVHYYYLNWIVDAESKNRRKKEIESSWELYLRVSFLYPNEPIGASCVDVDCNKLSRVSDDKSLHCNYQSLKSLLRKFSAAKKTNQTQWN